MAIQAVIWDMDGVLVDSEVYWLKARQDFAQALGKTWTDADQRKAMGRSTIEWAQVMKDILQPDMPVAAIMADVIRRVMAQYDEHLPTRPGALDAVHLSAQHFKVALASGSPTAVIQHVLKLTGLDRVLPIVVYGDDMKNGKPAPDIYIEAMRQLGVTPEVSLGIEDSGNGIRALKAAQMYAIAAPSPAFPLSDELLHLADAHITTLEEFTLPLIAGIGQ
jgi:HAD superfamily hydrolase (TIGR01509 family)